MKKKLTGWLAGVRHSGGMDSLADRRTFPPGFRLGLGAETIEGHRRQIAIMERRRDEIEQLIAFRREAIRRIIEAGVGCLNDKREERAAPIEGKEGPDGQGYIR